MDGAVTVTVTAVNDNESFTVSLAKNSENWEDYTLTISGRGFVYVTIQDYYYCKPTTIKLFVGTYDEVIDLGNSDNGGGNFD